MLKLIDCSSTFPNSKRKKSNISLIIQESLCAFEQIVSIYSFCLALSPVFLVRSLYFKTSFMVFWISFDIPTKN